MANVELNEIGFRYGGRIFELRREGFCIETVPEGAGLFRFVLHAGSGAARGGAVEVRAREANKGTPAMAWTARGECDAKCRCFHHTFCGAGGAPCIACP